MKKLLASLLFIITTIAVQAQTVDEVINKHIEALGGRDVIGKIKSMVMESDLTVMGSTFPNTSTLLVGKGFRNEANFQGQAIISAYTPTSGWQINPLMGMTSAEALPEDQVKGAQSSLTVAGEFADYKEKGGKAELAGNETIGGVNTIKIKMTSKDGKETTYFIDPSTYYILKSESSANIMGQQTNVTAVFSNYKKTDFGFVIPYSSTINQGFEITINVTKVEFNKEVDPKIFEMPK